MEEKGPIWLLEGYNQFIKIDARTGQTDISISKLKEFIENVITYCEENSIDSVSMEVC